MSSKEKRVVDSAAGEIVLVDIIHIHCSTKDFISGHIGISFLLCKFKM